MMVCPVICFVFGVFCCFACGICYTEFVQCCVLFISSFVYILFDCLFVFVLLVFFLSPRPWALELTKAKAPHSLRCLIRLCFVVLCFSIPRPKALGLVFVVCCCYVSFFFVCSLFLFVSFHVHCVCVFVLFVVVARSLFFLALCFRLLLLCYFVFLRPRPWNLELTRAKAPQTSFFFMCCLCFQIVSIPRPRALGLVVVCFVCLFV